MQTLLWELWEIYSEPNRNPAFEVEISKPYERGTPEVDWKIKKKKKYFILWEDFT